MSDMLMFQRRECSSEEERRIKRAETKDTIEHVQHKRALAAIVSRDLAQQDRLADAAADLHKSEIEPIQARLDQLRESMAKALRQGRDVPPDAQSERTQLLSTKRMLNERLATAIAEIDAERKRLRKERAGILKDLPSVEVLHNHLASQELASWSLFCEHHGWHRMVQHVQAAVQRADDQVATFERGIIESRRAGYHDRVADYTRGKDRWQAAVVAARELMGVVNAKCRELREAMIAE